MSNIDNEPFFIVPGGSSFGAVHATQGEFQVEAVHLDLTSQKPGFQAMKRILDIFISVIALVALPFPLLLLHCSLNESLTVPFCLLGKW